MAGTTENKEKLNLKIIVDSKADKVVFAEAGKDFVDFLLNMLSLPLTIVVKLLSSEEMTGSLPSLYKSVESLSTQYFEKDLNAYTALSPKHPIALPMLSLDHTPSSVTYFKCPDHNIVSYRKAGSCGSRCGSGYCPSMKEVTFFYVKPNSKVELPGFVKGPVRYMVTDNLEVKPLSTALIKSHVNDFDVLAETEVVFGPKEALALLRASLETHNVLTTVFLGNKNKNP